ncbi:hypothetical protein OO013_12195 [Mangrovivirga sp. M17]|uniref:Uncharacterized protein n=1 Tax=Mangrovivirga halotolerans TaxID=2993936 RepID=A0ABT3RS75_9BACT|nr:DUF6687 family protein [Mangrovivirga halotolerans]MCX2744634.1 hypothetical protein [Mangrovivirga halotolerans]
MKFVPFHNIPEPENCLAVDCTHRKALPLSHWRGAPSPENIHDDTSAAICLNAIKANLIEGYRYVTNNHFDIDGFMGVWALMEPELALKNEQLIRQAALIGDFRELPDLNDVINDKALKIVCLINKIEKDHFYAPFEAQDQEDKESKACVEKYEYFLPRLKAYLNNIDHYADYWKEEYECVINGLRNINSIKYDDSIRLTIIHAKKPVHYYSLFKGTENSDMVITVYSENRFELEYKYTSWVDTNRLSYPRVDLTLLTERLNKLEENPGTWIGDKITDTGPILRLSRETLSKAQRFDHPFNRPIHKSSIPEEQFIKIIHSYFKEAYNNIQPQKKYSWEEIKEWNKQRV